MNTIATFRLCTLSDADLLKKVDHLTDEMFTKQKVPILQIPARPNDDYDILIGELIIRYSELQAINNAKEESKNKSAATSL